MTHIAENPPRPLSRQLTIAVLSMAILVILGWLWLGLMVLDYVASGDAERLGAGAGILDRFLGPQTLDPLTRAMIESLCRPVFGTDRALSASAFGMMVSMWAAMAMAMMLPTAVPMVVAYADKADEEQEAGRGTASSLWLIMGYLLVWLVFSLVASALQVLLIRASVMDPVFGTVNGLFAGAILLAAGLYQFTPAKLACLERCQRPFPFFIAHWSATPMGVFRLGIRQGLDCFGCCAATMFAAFAFGVMNPIWMLIAGLIMATEKLMTTARFSRAMGALMVLAGLAFLYGAIAARLPGLQ